MDETKWLIAQEIPKLRRYALALTGDPVTADDLVQDTLERAIRKRRLWRRSGSIRNWLYRIQFNVFLNQARHRHRRRNEVDIDEVPSRSEPSHQEQKIVCRDIVSAMLTLPHQQRAAIALTAIEGLSYDEAAAVLEIPLGTLRSRLSRGREQLRERYPDTMGETHLRRVK